MEWNLIEFQNEFYWISTKIKLKLCYLFNGNSTETWLVIFFGFRNISIFNLWQEKPTPKHK